MPSIKTKINIQHFCIQPFTIKWCLIILIFFPVCDTYNSVDIIVHDVVGFALSPNGSKIAFVAIGFTEVVFRRSVMPKGVRAAVILSCR